MYSNLQNEEVTRGRVPRYEIVGTSQCPTSQELLSAEEGCDMPKYGLWLKQVLGEVRGLPNCAQR